jgi:addiction module HigA family antidote
MSILPHPADVIRDRLLALGWSQVLLAAKMDRPLVTVHKLIYKKRGVTAAIAIDLAKALGGSAEFWMHLQANYDLAMERERRK